MPRIPGWAVDLAFAAAAALLPLAAPGPVRPGEAGLRLLTGAAVAGLYYAVLAVYLAGRPLLGRGGLEAAAQGVPWAVAASLLAVLGAGSLAYSIAARDPAGAWLAAFASAAALALYFRGAYYQAARSLLSRRGAAARLGLALIYSVVHVGGALLIAEAAVDALGVRAAYLLPEPAAEALEWGWEPWWLPWPASIAAIAAARLAGVVAARLEQAG